MLLAVIDLGSNSFKMTVAQYVGSHRKVPFKILHKERHPVQLGASVFSSARKISPQDRMAGLKAMSRMKNNLLKFNCPLVRVVGTSALRDASNGSDFVRDCEKHVGIKIDVISGLNEARVISQGLEWEYPFVKKGVLVDIGGGSTEVACFGSGWKEKEQVSLRTGSVRLLRDWNARGNPKVSEDRLRRKVRETLALSIKPPKKFEYLVGSAGAIQSMGNILSNKRKNVVIHLSDLDAWISENMNVEPKSLALDFDLAPSRARVVVPGAVILSEVLHWLKQDHIYVTQMTLRNGMLVELVEQLRRDNLILS